MAQLKRRLAILAKPYYWPDDCRKLNHVFPILYWVSLISKIS